MRTLSLLALLLVAGCGDDGGTAGGTGTSTSTGNAVGQSSLQATIPCAGAPVTLSCPGATTTLTTTLGAAGEMTADCLDNDGTRVNIVVPAPQVGDLRALGAKYFVAITCADSSVQSISEISGGTVNIDSIDPGVQIKGSFTSDAMDASGTFVVVAQ